MMGPLLGAALSFGTSLISGLFGKSGAKKRANEERQAIDAANKENKFNADYMNAQTYVRAVEASRVPIVTKVTGEGNLAGMVADAVKNGFNPLTVLRSGGQSLYSKSTSTVTGSTAMDAALSGQHMSTVQPLISQTQVPSTGEVFGSALQAGVGTYSSMMSTRQAQQFQMDLLSMQLEGANQNTILNHQLSRSFHVPSAQTGGSYTRSGGAEVADGKTVSASSTLGRLLNNVPFLGPLGDTKAPPPSTKDPSYYSILGIRVLKNPYQSDAQVLEDRHGDDISKFTAPLTAGADLYYNLRSNPDWQWELARKGGSLLLDPTAMVRGYLLRGNWSVPKGAPLSGPNVGITGKQPTWVPRNVTGGM